MNRHDIIVGMLFVLLFSSLFVVIRKELRKAARDTLSSIKAVFGFKTKSEGGGSGV